MGTLIDGKAIAAKIQNETAKRTASLRERGIIPKLAVILVGDDKASHTYVRKKGEAAKAVGMEFALYSLPESCSTAEVVRKLETVQADGELSGLIVQLPLPDQIDTAEALRAIDPDKDIDCLTETNLGMLIMKTNDIVPPTPGAVISILEELGVNLIGKNVTIIGVGALVGKPLAIMMINARASVTTCNSKTKDTKEKCLAADIIVTGVGKKDILRGDMVSPGAIVIDTGVDFVDGKMYGDVNVTEVLEKAAFVTPTPGGVGPITVARLLLNTVILAERYDADKQIGADMADIADADEKGSKLIYSDLTYQLNSIFFNVQNELGRYYNEMQYSDKIEEHLKNKGIAYKREYMLSPSFHGEKNGRNKIDFLIENKIILEIKAKRFIGADEYYQTQRYLHAINKKLGILVNFRDTKIKPRRVLNSQYKDE